MLTADFTKMTDYDLVLACINGDKAAFNELLQRYKNLVYSVALRMVNDKEEANDLAQEIFIKIYRNLEKYHPEYRFSTWTIKIATNHVIDYRRKKRQDTVSIDEVGDTLAADHAESPEAAYLAKEQRQMLHDLIDDLPDMYKVPIVLYHQQGLSYTEISEITGETLSKVKNRIFRGRKMLKESLMDIKQKSEPKKELKGKLKGGESYGV